MEVIDGQHRLAVAKNLNLPIYYITAPEANIAEMVLLNAYTKAWGLDDYLNLYVRLGKKEYIEVAEFKKKFHRSTNVAMQFLSMSFGATTGIRSIFKAGEFVVTHKEEAEKYSTELEGLREFMVIRVSTDRSFLSAYIQLRKQVEIDIFLKKTADYKTKIEMQKSVRAYMRHFEDILNFRMRENLTRLY